LTLAENFREKRVPAWFWNSGKATYENHGAMTCMLRIPGSHNWECVKRNNNSGNNQEIQQGCGNSCTQTSLNTVSSGSSGLTSPSPAPAPTTLTLSVFGITPIQFSGTLTTDSPNIGPRVVGATITFTQIMPGDPHTYPVTTDPSQVQTDANGNYFVNDALDVALSANITAHYAGCLSGCPSNSAPFIGAP
jgi:hypothetical protein